MVRPRQEYRLAGASAAVAGAQPRDNGREEERRLPGQRAEAGRYPGTDQRAIAEALGDARYSVPRAARGRTPGSEAGQQGARQAAGKEIRRIHPRLGARTRHAREQSSTVQSARWRVEQVVSLRPYDLSEQTTGAGRDIFESRGSRATRFAGT